jgi:hypothetical protein
MGYVRTTIHLQRPFTEAAVLQRMRLDSPPNHVTNLSKFIPNPGSICIGSHVSLFWFDVTIFEEYTCNRSLRILWKLLHSGPFAVFFFSVPILLFQSHVSLSNSLFKSLSLLKLLRPQFILLLFISSSQKYLIFHYFNFIFSLSTS